MKKLTALILSIILLFSMAAMFTGCKKEFTVTFDGNGGVLKVGSNIEEVQTVKSASELVPPTYEREGYIFVDWDCKLSEIKTTTTVKAVWKANRYTVSFNGNGGTLKSGNEQQSVIKPSEIVPPVYEKTGYTLSWDRDISTITETAEVKAIWTANKYKINFMLNGGEFEAGTNYATEGIEVTYGQPIGVLPKPTKQDKKFDKWVDENNNLMSNNAKYNRTSDIWLSAQWIDLTPYNISYDLAGGESVNNPTTYLETTETFVLIKPTKVGCEFSGWVGTGLSEPTMDVAIEQGSTGDRYYVATWTVKDFKVTFNPTDGATCEMDFKTVTFGTAFGELPIPQKANCEFKGWYYGLVKIDSTSIFEYVTDIELVARYDEQYVIVFDLCYEHTNINGTEEFRVTVDGRDYLEPVYVDEGSLETFVEDYFYGKVVASTNELDFRFDYWGYKKNGKYEKIEGSKEVIGPSLANADGIIVIYAVCKSYYSPVF